MNNSFVFYESWAHFIDRKDRETAKELVYQIYRVGLGKELDTDNEEIIDIIDAFILPNIQGAKRRYNTAVANGSKGGRPLKTDAETDEKMYQLHLEGWTYEQIAEEFNLNKNTVGARVRQLRELKTKNQNEKLNSETKTETFKTKNKNISNKEKDNEEEIESDNNLSLHYDFINNK